ncbi:MAG: hypothetical protein ACRCXC_09095 [Legionella sp.]
MIKLFISLVLSIPLFLTPLIGYSAPVSTLDNPVIRTHASSAVNNNLPKAGTNYAYYWHRWHHGHRHWHHWHYY